MTELIKDAVIDTSRTIPFLLLIYIAIEFFEYKYSQKLRENVEKAGNAGPLIGSLTGSFPQCGFSVIISALYTQRLVTIGTLLAVYIATSDEAIPVILSQPDKIKIILPLILTKIGLALFAGYLIDFIFRKKNKVVLQHIEKFERNECHHDHEIDEAGCCGHEVGDKHNVWDLLAHPINHTIKISVFIFLATLVMNYIFYKLGDQRISQIFLSHSVFQPIITAFVGLIPNCAASVAITEMYLKNTISFGSTISGLAAGGGLGLLILLKENKNLKNTLTILGLLLLFSITAGELIQYIYG